MKIYNETKTKILENVDLEKGYLKEDKIFIRHHERVMPMEEQGHYETIAEYPNGGKDIKWVIDIKKVEGKEAWNEYEEIKVYIPYTQYELIEREKEQLRIWREKYFDIIDCAVWYDCLTKEEKEEVKAFRYALLDITKTMIKPIIPSCVLGRIKNL